MVAKGDAAVPRRSTLALGDMKQPCLAVLFDLGNTLAAYYVDRNSGPSSNLLCRPFLRNCRGGGCAPLNLM